ncbi:MAG: hypothetical protein Q9185_005176 [Variospora sp. 1 TL-2023]
MADVSFIPPQKGPITQFSIRALHSGPLWLITKDLGILITVLPYLPLLFFPWKKRDQQDKHLRFKSFRDTVIQALLLVIELVLSILVLPALVWIPVILFVAIAVACVLLIGLLAWPTQGPRIAESTMDDKRALRLPQQDAGERWVFINGICTGASGLQQNIDRLSLLFGRKVLGIHNQSYGLISDLLECVVQRCLSYSTMDARIAYEILTGYLADEKVNKVVLVAHSQGGIIASMVVDHLLAELSEEMMGKLEIYTFGSAASSFNNPPRTNATQQSPCIPHIEHYANEYDMVPRWGLLYGVKSLLTNRYAGNVFVRTGAMGHMFVDHYLNPIFPLPGGHERRRNDQGKKASVKGGGQQMVNGDDGATNVEDADQYLDATVHVDTDTEAKRMAAEPKSSVVHKRGGGKKKRVAATPVVVDGFGVDDANRGIEAKANMIIVAPATGKKVKELSRMWKYLDGATPLD